MICIEGDIEGAWDYAMDKLVLLLKRQVPVGILIKTQQFSKDLQRYGYKIEIDQNTGTKVKVATPIGPAVALALRIAKQVGYEEALIKNNTKKSKNIKIDPEDHIKYDLYPQGSIVDYIIVERDWQKTRKTVGLSSIVNKHTDLKKGDQSEEPFKVIRDNLPYDIDYYLDESLKILWKLFAGPFDEIYIEDTPSLRKKSIFWNRVKNESRLNKFTRKKEIQTTSPLFKHLVEIPKCIVCKVNINQNQKIPLCEDCLPFEEYHKMKVYNNLKFAYNARETVYDTCKTCMNTDDIEDIEGCTAKSCPNFIMRKETTSKIMPYYKIAKKLNICYEDD